MKLPVFGIHVGNSSASLAVCKEDGKIDVISNEIGDRITPAVVTIMNHEILVGSVANSLSMKHSNCTIAHNKQLINRSMSEIKKKEICNKSSVSINYEGNKIFYNIPNGEKFEKYTPIQIATLIYKKLYAIAKSAIHAGEDDVISCVMLIPSYFDSDSIEDIKNAAKLAGWRVLQMIKESVSPVLAYSLLAKTVPVRTTSFKQCIEEDVSREILVLVYRLGGTSCEATVMKLFSGMVHVLSTSYKNNIEANHPIISVTNYLVEEFKKKYKEDISNNTKSMAKLRRATETCMHTLSNLNNADCFVESIYDGLDFKHSISRVRMEACLSPLLSVCSEPIQDVLKITGIGIESIEKVILCGGLMKIPKIKSYISGVFPNAEVLSEIAPDEVLAYGAAKQAGHLVTNIRNKSSKLKSVYSNLIPELPLTYPVQFTNQQVDIKIHDNSDYSVHFERFSVIPCHKNVFINNVKFDKDFCIEVFVEGIKTHFGQVTVDAEEYIHCQLDIILTLKKQLEIKLTNYYCQNKSKIEFVSLKPVLL